MILPVQILIPTQAIIATMIPFEIEYVKGMKAIAKNPPIASAMSPEKLIFLTDESMSSPTKSIAGVVANEVMARKNGANTMEMIKSTAVTTAVSPVLPPTDTPAVDST